VVLLREPPDARIRRFLDEQRSLPFSYPEVGASRDGAPPGYPANHHRGYRVRHRRRASRGRDTRCVGQACSPNGTGPTPPKVLRVGGGDNLLTTRNDHHSVAPLPAPWVAVTTTVCLP